MVNAANGRAILLGMRNFEGNVRLTRSIPAAQKFRELPRAYLACGRRCHRPGIADRFP